MLAGLAVGAGFWAIDIRQDRISMIRQATLVPFLLRMIGRMVLALFLSFAGTYIIIGWVDMVPDNLASGMILPFGVALFYLPMMLPFALLFGLIHGACMYTIVQRSFRIILS
jgi:hypothetical protein